jgi:hypothetical protein
VVRYYGEMPGLQHVSEVSHGLIYCQELHVVRAVLLLCRAQLPGEEGEGLPVILKVLLQNGTHSGC